LEEAVEMTVKSTSSAENKNKHEKSNEKFGGSLLLMENTQ
jgi:hypothetical protein